MVNQLAEHVRGSTTASTHAMLTRSRTTAIVRQAVFHTTELLEIILANLPLQSLMELRRVCTHWNVLILISPSIKRKLYMTPKRVSEKWVVDKRTETVMKYVKEHKTRTWTDDHGSVVVATSNSLLFTGASEEDKDAAGYKHRYEHCETLRFKHRPDLKLLGVQHSIVHGMFVCNPPCKKLEMHLEYTERKLLRKGCRKLYEKGIVRHVVENETGVTLGDVLKAFIDVAGPGRIDYPDGGHAINIKKSMLWCIGVIFPSKKEVATAEANAARDVQKATKMTCSAPV